MDPEVQRQIDALTNQVRDLEDLVRNHNHKGYDLSPKLLNTTMNSMNVINASTLGDGLENSGTLRLNVADGRGDSFIVAGLDDGDFTNAGGKTGWIIGIDDSDNNTPKFYFGSTTNYISWDGTTLTIQGTFNATSGTIGGFVIGSDYIRDVANSFGLASTVTGGDDVRFWAGAAFADRATAPFRVTESGLVTARQVSSTIAVKLRNLNTQTAGEAIDASTTSQLVYKSTSDGKVYKSDANDTGKNRWIGFIDNAQNISSNGSCEVVTEGIVGGFSGLTTGAQYYISDTAGAISSTPSTTFVGRVGIAVSTTEILLYSQSVKQTFGTSGYSTTTQNQVITNTITLGFRPRLIVCQSIIRQVGGDAYAYVGNGGWGDTDQGWAGFKATNANENTAETGYIIRSDFSAGHVNDTQVKIKNATDTTFDVEITIGGAQTGATNSGTIIYEAFGA